MGLRKGKKGGKILYSPEACKFFSHEFEKLSDTTSPNTFLFRHFFTKQQKNKARDLTGREISAKT